MKKQLLFLFATLLPLLACAQTKVEIDRIWYNLDSEEKQAEVTDGRNYSGSIAIPTTVTYNDVEYSVTRVGYGAFEGCSSLTAITIPEGVTRIEDLAFDNCIGLKKVFIEDGSSPLSLGFNNYSSGSGQGLFYDCPLEEVYLGRTPDFDIDSRSGYSPFYNKTKLKTLTIGGNVTIIGYNTFMGCSSLTSITIPASVTWIGDYAFRDCSSLTTVTFSKDSKLTSTGHWAFMGCSSLISITIPEGVTSIGYYTFYGCSSLATITIPESVTSIGGHAFYGCSSLTTITCEAVTPPTVGDSYTFVGVNKSIPVYVPAGSVAAYQSTAYWGEFTNMRPISTTDIPSGTCGDNLIWKLTEDYELIIEGTGDMYDFSTAPWHYYRESVKTVTITKNVKSIGSCAFEGCSSLTAIKIPEGVTIIGTRAFANCSKLKSIQLSEGVKYIGYEAFYDCKSLVSITLPQSVVSLNWYSEYPPAFCGSAFANCQSLVSINIPTNLRKVPDGTFSGCSSLRAIDIPESVTSIGMWAFSGCSNLTSVVIPANVEVIDYSAFSGCSNLTSITCEATTPPVCYDNSPFDGVDKQSCVLLVPTLASVSLYKSATSWSEFRNVKSLDGLVASGICGEKLTWKLFDNDELVIEGTGAMYNYDSAIDVPWIKYGVPVKSVIIKDGVTHIGDRAFECCSSLTSITIPEGVIRVGNDAFEGCTSLTTINIPESMTSIGDQAFSGCSSLTAVNIPENSKLTSIGEWAFSGCSSLIAINIPEGVTSIGNWAFSDCSSLTAITLPEGVTCIGSGAFADCSSLTSITLPEGVTSIGEGAFSHCSSLTSITLPEGVTSIEGYAFSGCSSITAINIPEGVTSIGNFAFYGCSSLTAITIPEGVTSIGWYAFFNCSSLTAITIPEGVTSIGDWAFEDCSSLTAITLPESVTSIGYYAFRGCSSLTDVYCYAEGAPTTQTNAFDNSNIENATLHVPANALNAYKTTAPWSSFGTIVALTEEGTAPTEVTITINQYGSGTYCSEYALDFSNVEGLKAYAATGYNELTGMVTLTRVMTAKAGVGLFIKGEPGEYMVPIMENSVDNTLNMLVGTLAKTAVNATSGDGLYANYKYTIKEGNSQPLFYRFTDGSTLGAGKAYLQIPMAWLPQTSETKSISLRFEEGEGTTDIENSQFTIHNSQLIYDLYGRRVDNPVKGGIYIVGGRKVVY